MDRAELKEIVAKKLEANPGIKTSMLAETLKVPELAVLRAMPEGHNVELAPESMEDFITELSRLGLLYVVCRNAGCVAEIKGHFGGFNKSGPFLNVSNDDLHLHIRLDRIATAFAVIMRPKDGSPAMYSIQLFQPNGEAALKVFLISRMQEAVGENFEENVAKFNQLVEATPVRELNP